MSSIDNQLIQNIREIVEDAAKASYFWVGKKNNIKADEAAVEAMRKGLNKLNISATVVIGEGERDNAPMLFIGEKLGMGGVELDIAVDPLEGTNLCANNLPNAISVLTVAKRGSLLQAPDVYMSKICIPEVIGELDLDADITDNIYNIAKKKKCDISEIKVIMLDRERHNLMKEKINSTGAQLFLISDGDIVASTLVGEGKFDMYVGIGGAPEGVISAAILKSFNGYMEARLIFNNQFNKPEKNKLKINDMVKTKAYTFIAGVTDGELVSAPKNDIVDSKIFITEE